MRYQREPCVLLSSSTGVKGEVQGNLFKIITKSDTHYYIQAPTQADKMAWIDAIRKEV